MSIDLMIRANLAGQAYWQRNKPVDATREGLASLARSCGWHGKHTEAWLRGFDSAKASDQAFKLEHVAGKANRFKLTHT
jgi:hypothetical protein